MPVLSEGTSVWNVGFGLLLAAMVAVFLLGELWGRESGKRRELYRAVKDAELDLHVARNDRAEQTTPGWTMGIVLVLLVVGVLGSGAMFEHCDDWRRTSERWPEWPRR
jgi:hypothetical protein